MSNANPASEAPAAVVLLSGGLDSATVLAMAQAQGLRCYTMSYDYGQRHRAELQAAERVACAAGVVEHKVIGMNLGGIGGSALTDDRIAVPEGPQDGIPVTYVPARNTLFLSLALGWAEVLGRGRFLSASTQSITRAIPIAGRSLSRRSNALPIWPPVQALRVKAFIFVHLCST